MWWSLGTTGLRFAGVGYRPSHKQPSGDVKERQAASLSLFPHDGHHLFDALGLAALFVSPGVHLGSLRAAGAGGRRLNADFF